MEEKAVVEENLNLVDFIQEKLKDDEVDFTKSDIRLVIKTLTDNLAEIVFKNGEVRLGSFGKIILRAVPARKGVTKLQGEAKEWETEAHWTAKLALFQGARDAFDDLEEKTGEFASKEFE